MKITVGKAYEGASSNWLEDGDYELQITEVESTKGRVKLTMATSTGFKVSKMFFLLEKDGKTPNEKGMRELADYITTAMQIEDEQVEVDTDNAIGFYLLCYVKKGSYKKIDEEGKEVEKRVYNVYSPRRCNGFSNGSESQVEEEPQEEDSLPFNTDVTPSEDAGTDMEDIFKKLGV